MLKIRLARTGKRNAASFRIVLQEVTRKPTGKFIELLGFYNPRLKQRNLKKERIQYWLQQGAQVTDTVHNLLVSAGLIKGPKIKVHKTKKTKKEEKPQEKEQTAEQKPEEAKKPEEKPEKDKKEEAPQEPKKQTEEEKPQKEEPKDETEEAKEPSKT